MGFFDNLVGLFTGDPVKKAAEQSRAAINRTTGQVGDIIGQARGTGMEGLQTGLTGALDYLGPAFDQARADITGYLDPAVNALTGYGTQALGQLQTGITSGAGALNQSLAQALGLLSGAGTEAGGAIREGVAGATGAYNPLDVLGATYGGRTTEASDAIRRALGLAGPAGTAQSRADFTASPAYNFNLEQGLEAINRARAARGELSGGNIDRDTQQFGAGLASREWNDYINRLSEREGRYVGFEPQLASTAATGRAGAYTSGFNTLGSILAGLGQTGAGLAGQSGRDLASLFTNMYGKGADILRGMGTDISGLYGRTGQNLAELAGREGIAGAGFYGDYGGRLAQLMSSLAGTQTGYLGQTLQPVSQTYMDAAKAQMQGAQNFVNLGTDLAKAAAGQGWFGLTPMKA